MEQRMVEMLDARESRLIAKVAVALVPRKTSF
jgi:hypothetical protein